MPLLLILFASTFLWADATTRYWISDTITRPYFVSQQDPNYTIYQKGFFVAQEEESELTLTFYDQKKEEFELSATIELELHNGNYSITDIDVNHSWDEESVKTATVIYGKSIQYNDYILLPVLPNTPQEQQLNKLIHPDFAIDKAVRTFLSYTPLLILGIIVVALVI